MQQTPMKPLRQSPNKLQLIEILKKSKSQKTFPKVAFSGGVLDSTFTYCYAEHKIMNNFRRIFVNELAFKVLPGFSKIYRKVIKVKIPTSVNEISVILLNVQNGVVSAL